MKQKLSIFLAVALVVLLNLKTNAQCGQDQVGTPNFVTNTNMSCMAVAPTGTVYTFFYNTGNSKFELYKSGLGSGSSPVAVISTSSTVRPAMAISKTGKVSIFLRDDNAGKIGKLYYLSGSSLIQQGLSISSGVISDLSITFDSFGNEYVAYTDQSNGNFATVKKWNSGGGTWDNLGAGGIANSGASFLNSLALNNSDTPLLAFKDANDSINIKKFDGANWELLTKVGAFTNNLNLRITSDDNLIIGYVETSSNVTIKKYDFASWNQLGSTIPNMSVNMGDFELGLDGADSPMFVGIESGNFFPIVYRFDGTDWISQGYLASFASSNSKIGFDKTGAPYFQFSNTGSNNAANIKTIGANYYITAQPTSTLVCDGNNGSFSVAINGTITPTYQWQVSYGGPFVFAITPYHNTSSPTTTFVATTSMNQDKLRAIVDIGCKNIISNTTTLTVAVNPTVTTTVSNVNCFGGSDGNIITTVTGGITPYNYNWSSGPTTANLLNVTAGTYSVNIKDANNCKTSITETITQPSAIVSTIAGTQTICAGKNTTLTITNAGGNPPYTFNWSPSASLNSSTLATVIASPTVTTIYTVTSIDANSCTNTTTINITVNNPLPFTISPATPTICQGTIINMTVSPNNTYTLLPGGSTGDLFNISPAATTIYTVQGIDVNGCFGTQSYPVTVNTTPTANAGSSQTLTCANPTRTLTGSGGVTYSWSGPGIVSGATTANPIVNTSGLYSLTVTSAAGCVSSPATVSVFQNTVTPNVTATNTGSLNCITTNANVVASTTTSPVSYNWTGPGITAGAGTGTITVNQGGTYNYTVTNTSNGCINSGFQIITQNTIAPNVTASNTGSLNCTTTSINVAATTTATPVNYNWSGPGITAGAGTGTITANQGGTYNYTVTNTSNGCLTSGFQTITQNITTPNVIASNTGSLNCSVTSVNVAATTTTSPVSYNWTGVGITAGAGTGTISVNQGGTYNYTVTNTSNGCSTPGFQTIAQNTVAPSVTSGNTGPLTCSTTTATAYASTTVTPVSYNWSGAGITAGAGTGTITINVSGTYNYTVTNTNNNCFVTGSQNVAQNALVPAVSASSSGTLNCFTNTVALNGTPASGVTYTWTGPGIVSGTNTQNAIANLPGTYTLTVKSIANGCTNSATTSVSQNTVIPSLSMPSTQSITCSMAVVNLVASAVPATCTAVWSGGVDSGVNSYSATASSSNIYTLTVTNPANGCVKSGTVQVVTNTSSPTITTSTSNTLTCITLTTQVVASTTTTPVSYSWSGPGIISGNVAPNATVNLPGLYSVTVTNTSNGCSVIGSTSVAENTVAPIGVSAGPDQTLGCLSSSVTLNGSVSSPTNSVINWQGGVCGTNNTLLTSACIAGSYTLVVTNPDNGCFASDIVDVFPNAGAPDLNVSATNSLNCTFANADISAVTTSTNSVSYSWSGPGIISGFGTPVITINAPGSYSINLTDLSNSCVTSSLITISQDITTPSITLNATSNTICVGDMVSITANGADNYIWDGGSTSSVISPNPSTSTTYSLIGTNFNGCSSTASITINVNALPVLSISGNTVLCANSTTSLTASGAVNYNWSSGHTSAVAVITPSVSDTYTVTGTDANNCVGTQTIYVSIISSKDISGTITSTISTTGNVTLYKYTALLSKWDSISTVPFSSSYIFNNVDSALYVVRAMPSATNIQVTYGDSAISWQNATVINHGCSSNSTQNIKLIPLENIGIGSGTISGTIYEGVGFGQRFFNEGNKPTIPGGPIGGIIVKGGKNPGGQMFTQTTTNAAGEYTLVNVPDNSLGEEYFIYVDIPGLDTSSTYHFIVSPGSNQITGLDFSVDSMYINPVGIVTGINSNSVTDVNSPIVFPNPTKNFTYIQYELLQNSKSEISLFDILGNKIETILPEQEQVLGKYRILFNTAKYSNGVYLIKTTINNSSHTTKLLINE